MRIVDLIGKLTTVLREEGDIDVFLSLDYFGGPRGDYNCNRSGSITYGLRVDKSVKNKPILYLEGEAD